MTEQESTRRRARAADLTERMRRAAEAVYLATDAEVADDLAAMLKEAAAIIDEQNQALAEQVLRKRAHT